MARSICIVAAKNLRHNTRVARQATALSENGYRVAIAALELPLGDQLDGIELIRIQTWRPLQRLLGADKKRQPQTHGDLLGRTDSQSDLDVSGARASLVRVLRACARPFAQRITSLLFAHACRNQISGTYDVIQAHDALALRAAVALARRQKAKLAYDGVEFVDNRAFASSDRLFRFIRRLESKIEAKIIRQADASFAIGPSMQAWMSRRYQIPAPTVVRNCRNFEPAKSDPELRARIGASETDVVILYLNSIAPGRGVEQVLHALTHTNTPFRLAILGDTGESPYAQLIRQEIEALGLSNRVHFIPPCPSSDVVRMSSGADIGVIPFLAIHHNHYYSLPNRIFEMIMARLPVGASNFPDLSALINEHKIGLTFEPQEARSIANALDEINRRRKSEFWTRALEKAATSLNWEKESETYLDRIGRLFPQDN